MMIRDLTFQIKTSVWLFVDDCTIYHRINNPLYSLVLQIIWTELQKWSSARRKNIHASKTKFTFLEQNCSHSPVASINYTPIYQAMSYKYLGLTQRNIAPYILHILIIIKKAYWALVYLSWCLHLSLPDVKCLAYKNVIIPHLQYISIICNFPKSNHINALASFIGEASRFIQSYYDEPSILAVISPTLERSRLLGSHS